MDRSSFAAKHHPWKDLWVNVAPMPNRPARKAMAANRINRDNPNDFTRCKSEGDLIDFSDPHPSQGSAKHGGPAPFCLQEVVAIQDHTDNTLTTLRFSRGEHLYVLDSSGPAWWYAHNSHNAGYIPASHVRPVMNGGLQRTTLADSGMVDNFWDSDEVHLTMERHSGKTASPLSMNSTTSSLTKTQDEVQHSPVNHQEGSPNELLIDLEFEPKMTNVAEESDVFPTMNNHQRCLSVNPTSVRTAFASTLERRMTMSGESNPFWKIAAISNPFLNHMNVNVSPNTFSKASENTSLDDPLIDVSDTMRGTPGSSINNDTSPVLKERFISKENLMSLYGSSTSKDWTENNKSEDNLSSPMIEPPNLSAEPRQRSKSMAELCATKESINGYCPEGNFSSTGLASASKPELLHDNRQAFREAWLKHRKLTRSCTDLGKTPASIPHQPLIVQTSGHLDSAGGSVQIPDTSITLHVPEGHVWPGGTRQVSLRALLDPPLKLSGHCSTVITPLVQVFLGDSPTLKPPMLEMKVSATVKPDTKSQNAAEIVCFSGTSQDGPFQPLPDPCIHGDLLQVSLKSTLQSTYVVAVARIKTFDTAMNNLSNSAQDASLLSEVNAFQKESEVVCEKLIDIDFDLNLNQQSAFNQSEPRPALSQKTGVWNFVYRKLTVGLYGPAQLPRSFTAILAIFGHQEAPRKMPLCDATHEGKSKKGAKSDNLILWGKHEFVLSNPQDLELSLFASESIIQPVEKSRPVRSFHLRLGRVCRLPFPFRLHGESAWPHFSLRVQIRDQPGDLLSQFSVAAPTSVLSKSKASSQRRFLKRREQSSVTATPNSTPSPPPPPPPPLPPIKIPVFQDRSVVLPHYAIALCTISRQNKSPYLLEYRKGDVFGLLSEERLHVRGHSKVKEWFVAYVTGRLGLVHCKNVKVLEPRLAKRCPNNVPLSTGILLDLLLRPCRHLTYSYVTLRATVSEGVADWKMLAHALGYNKSELDMSLRLLDWNEAEHVAAVLDKLRKDCNSQELRPRRSFPKELFTALLKLNLQAIFIRCLLDSMLLTLAVQVGAQWKHLAAVLARLSPTEAEAYESPHSKNGLVPSEMRWKPAYDFMVTWRTQAGDSYRDVLQDVHTALDKMREPPTHSWHVPTGLLMLVNGLEVLQAQSFRPNDD
uniref:SH3 domain-binding protein 4-like isoform X1 n=2 Tax=Myxine glutinosa TaxID=7769 RepID=UPI00358EADB0